MLHGRRVFKLHNDTSITHTCYIRIEIAKHTITIKNNINDDNIDEDDEDACSPRVVKHTKLISFIIQCC